MPKKKTNTKSKNVEETKRRTIMEQEKVVIYTQVATQEQAKEGYAIEAQRKTLREYAEENNLEIVKGFSDTGSGLKSSRKSFNEMLKFLESSEDCNTILVTKLDRLSRDFKTLSELQEKYSIIATKDGIGTQINTDIMKQIKNAMASYYYVRQSQIMKDAWKRRKEREAQQKEVKLEGGEV
ncbi:MAG: recombinase family protein [bacterium]|nr:recombinase family protein [bacterium]